MSLYEFDVYFYCMLKSSSLQQVHRRFPMLIKALVSVTQNLFAVYIVNEWCKNKRAQSKAIKPDNNPKYLMKRVDASKPLAFLGVRRYSYQQTEFTSCKNCAITLIIQPLKMSNAIIQQINGKMFLKKKIWNIWRYMTIMLLQTC